MLKRSTAEKLKHVVFYVITISLTVGFCYIVLEFVVARFYYSNVYLTSTVTFDELLGWRLRPGTYWTKPPNTFTKHRFYINRYGLRNRGISPVPGADTTRIVVLGDSFVFGKATPEKDIFTRRLETRLNEESDDTRYEVVNAGVPGYGNAQELLFMRELAGKEIRGDIYLLVVFTNDILDNLRRFYSTLEINEPQPGFVLTEEDSLVLAYPPKRKRNRGAGEILEQVPALGRAKIWAVLRIRLESFLQTKPEWLRALNNIGIKVSFPAMPGLLNAWYRDEILESGIPLTRRLIEEIKLEARRNDARLLVCFLPSQLQIYRDTYGQLIERTFPDSEQVREWLDDNERPQRETARMCEELDLPFCDVFPALHAGSRNSLYIPREGHLNARGHEIVARELAGFVRNNDG